MDGEFPVKVDRNAYPRPRRSACGSESQMRRSGRYAEHRTVRDR
jgi:hypothetical protein